MTLTETSRRPRPSGISPSLGLAFAFALVLAAALASSLSASLRGAASTVRARATDARSFGAGDTVRVLRNLGLIHPVPPDPPAGGASGLQAEAPLRYSLEPLGGRPVAESLRLDPATLRPGASVLALVMDPADAGVLHADPQARGRDAERPGFVGLVEDGELAFASGVGVRAHGGWTRRATSSYRSYRLHFRDVYGFDGFPGLFPSRASSPPSEVVVRHDGGVQGNNLRWYFLSPLAYDLARRIALPAPETRHAELVFNGHDLGLRALTEYVGPDFMRAHFGHERFLLYRTKRTEWAGPLVTEGDPERLAEFQTWLKGSDRDAIQREAGRRVDVSNLYRWTLLVSYCGTKDVFQGTMALDETDPAARWFWIAWDLDTSFGVPRDNGVRSAQRDVFNTVLHDNDFRSLLLQALLRPGTETWREFVREFGEVMNHRLGADFVESRLRHYEAIAARHGLAEGTAASFRALRSYVAARPEVLRRHMAKHLQTGPAQRVDVVAAPGTTLVIDGHRHGSRYEGWYFPGQTVEIAAADRNGRAPSAWRLGSGAPRAAGGGALRVEVTSDLRIEAVFAPRPMAATSHGRD